MKKIKRGDIYWVNLDPVLGSEQGLRRPAVIISNNTGNTFSDVVIVAPTTTQKINKIYPFEVFLEKGEGDIEADSKVMLDQIRVVDKAERLDSFIGHLGAKKMKDIDRAIKVSLALS